MKVYYMVFFVFFCVLIREQEITDKKAFNKWFYDPVELFRF